MADRWVCLDVGETLIDETRIWTCWADALGITPFTFMASMGAVLARGGEFRDVFEFLGRPDWQEHRAEVASSYAGFQERDLYPDALPALDSLRAAGYRLAIVANQPSERNAELRALGVEAEVMAMSEELGVNKPSPEFFAQALRLMGNPDPDDVAYVGDRLDNDVRPATAAGMRPVWLRRGPWSQIQADSPPAGTLVVESLVELVDSIASWWPAP
jgi:HAD superfamily hydrolase (TIGR01662 family)